MCSPRAQCLLSFLSLFAVNVRGFKLLCQRYNLLIVIFSAGCSWYCKAYRVNESTTLKVRPALEVKRSSYFPAKAEAGVQNPPPTVSSSFARHMAASPSILAVEPYPGSKSPLTLIVISF